MSIGKILLVYNFLINITTQTVLLIQRKMKEVIVESLIVLFWQPEMQIKFNKTIVKFLLYMYITSGFISYKYLNIIYVIILFKILHDKIKVSRLFQSM